MGKIMNRWKGFFLGFFWTWIGQKKKSLCFDSEVEGRYLDFRFWPSAVRRRSLTAFPTLLLSWLTRSFFFPFYFGQFLLDSDRSWTLFLCFRTSISSLARLDIDMDYFSLSPLIYHSPHQTWCGGGGCLPSVLCRCQPGGRPTTADGDGLELGGMGGDREVVGLKDSRIIANEERDYLAGQHNFLI